MKITSLILSATFFSASPNVPMLKFPLMQSLFSSGSSVVSAPRNFQQIARQYIRFAS